jgi:predicted metal-dependent phosphotriesterase family hydrolase
MMAAPMGDLMVAGSVSTVRGPVPAEELGLVMPHEHIIFDIMSQSGNPDNLCTDVDFMAEELKRFKQHGGGTICDVTMIGVGRDVEALRAVSELSGTHVVSGLGVYQDTTWPADFAASDEEGKVEYLVEEARRSGAAFFGEIASHNEPHADHCRYALLPVEEEQFRAVGKAALRTGLAISTHASMGRAGVEQLKVLKSVGVDLHRVIIGHVDTVAHADMSLDLEYYLCILEQGATVEFDFFGWDDDTMRGNTASEIPQGCMVNSERLERVATLVAQGFEGQIVISSDTCRLSQMSGNGGRGFTFILDQTLGELSEKGVSDEAIFAMTQGNMRRLLLPTAPALPAATPMVVSPKSPSGERRAGFPSARASLCAGASTTPTAVSAVCAAAVMRERNGGGEQQRPWWQVNCPLCPVGGMAPPSKSAPPSRRGPGAAHL